MPFSNLQSILYIIQINKIVLHITERYKLQIPSIWIFCYAGKKTHDAIHHLKAVISFGWQEKSLQGTQETPVALIEYLPLCEKLNLST